MTETLTREESMRVLREGGVTDSLIGAAFGISGQRVNAILGPHPKPPEAPEANRYPSDVPNLLRAWRKRHGMTQAAAARELGIHLGTFAPWEQGQTGCSLPGMLTRFISLYDEKHLQNVM